MTQAIEVIATFILSLAIMGGWCACLWAIATHNETEASLDQQRRRAAFWARMRQLTGRKS